MKFVSVFLVISAFVGLHCLEESDQHQEAFEARNVAQEQPTEETERAGYSHAYANAYNRPMARPVVPAGPTPLNIHECYVCTDCPTILSNTTSKMCPYTLDPAKRNKCVLYTEQYKYTKRPFSIRGCASERGSCADIRKAYSVHTDVVKLHNCYECEGDRCNGASHSLIDITMAFFAMVVSPLVAKYTLS